jgi:zinc protease
MNATAPNPASGSPLVPPARRHRGPRWTPEFPSIGRLVALLLAFGALGMAWAAPLTAQVTEPPPPLQEHPIQFPDFQEFTLENGLRVVMVPYGTQPIVSARLYARGGSALDPAGKAGLASLTAAVLTRGTGSRSADEISEEIEGVGGSLGASAGSDFLVVSVSSLTDHVETAFELLADVALNARFPGEELELERRRTLSGLQAQLGQPQAIAQRRFGEVVYGADHPYGANPVPETVQGVDREDVIRYRDRVLHPANTLLLVAGRIESDRMEALVRQHFGGWIPADPVDLEVPDPPRRDEAVIYLVHRPGSVQSVIGMGHAAVRPGHPDRFALEVMNRVLGGGVDARLFRILREERGWTYGAGSQITRPAGPGIFRAITEVRTEVTDSVLVELTSQLWRLRDEPVPDEEMDAAREYLAGSFPLRLETPMQVAGQIATTLLLELPLEEVTDYPQRIRQVSPEDVQRVAREHLHPDRAAIVVVGDGTQLLEKLEGMAPIRLFDPRGRALSREDVLGTAEPAAWDPARLRAGLQRYDVYVQGTPMGTAEYELVREGAEWVSTSIMSSPMGSQETRVTFSAVDFAPVSLEQDMAQGPARIQARVRVRDGHLTGEVELPEQLGGSREFDEELAPGTLLPGMDQYALAAADLEEGARFSLPVFDLTQGRTTLLQVEVDGQEEVRVPGGTFRTWRLRVTGGETPMTLYVRTDSPHILIRQEYDTMPVRLDLTASGDG